MGRPRAPRKKPRPCCVFLLLRSPAPGSSPEQQAIAASLFPPRVLSRLLLGDEAEKQKNGGCRRRGERARGRRRCRRCPCGRALPRRPPGSGTRRASRRPAAHRLCLRAEHAARGPGRAHARPRRGAARGSMCRAEPRRPEGWRCSRRRQRQGSGAAGEAGAAVRVGGKPSPLSLSLSLGGCRPLPGSSFAAASLPYPLAVTALLPCPRLPGKQPREGAHGPRSTGWGGDEEGGARLFPTPGRRRGRSWEFAG